MKKLWVLLIVAGLASACNNSSEGSDNIKDSALEKIDSSADAKIDSIENKTDSLKNVVEGTFEKTDSANRAMGDSATKN